MFRQTELVFKLGNVGAFPTDLNVPRFVTKEEIGTITPVPFGEQMQQGTPVATTLDVDGTDMEPLHLLNAINAYSTFQDVEAQGSVPWFFGERLAENLSAEQRGNRRLLR